MSFMTVTVNLKLDLNGGKQSYFLPLIHIIIKKYINFKIFGYSVTNVVPCPINDVKYNNFII